MRVYIRGTHVPLTPLEYRLITFLAHHKGRVVPGSELLDHLHGEGQEREANALEAVIARLRKKLGPGLIETRRGYGYTITDREPQ